MSKTTNSVDTTPSTAATPIQQFTNIEEAYKAGFRAGMEAARAAAGRRRAPGRPPFGFMKEDGQLVADPVQQAAAARLAKLREDGLSLRDLADAANDEMLLGSGGGEWTKARVRVALRAAERAEVDTDSDTSRPCWRCGGGGCDEIAGPCAACGGSGKDRRASR